MYPINDENTIAENKMKPIRINVLQNRIILIAGIFWALLSVWALDAWVQFTREVGRNLDRMFCHRLSPVLVVMRRRRIGAAEKSMMLRMGIQRSINKLTAVIARIEPIAYDLIAFFFQSTSRQLLGKSFVNKYTIPIIKKIETIIFNDLIIK